MKNNRTKRDKTREKNSTHRQITWKQINSNFGDEKFKINNDTGQMVDSRFFWRAGETMTVNIKWLKNQFNPQNWCVHRTGGFL